MRCQQLGNLLRLRRKDLVEALPGNWRRGRGKWMSRGFGLSWKTALLILACCFPARSQETQFLPEIDAHVELKSSLRMYVEAKNDRDGGDPTQFTIGPSIQFYLKPLVKLKRVKTFDLDDSKSRALVLEAGYRYITAPGAPTEERMVLAATSHFPLAAGFRLSDRNRADLDWKSGIFKWRYRNKLAVERTFGIRSYHLIPYVAAEPFYESQYSKWSTTSLYAGCLLPSGQTRRIQHLL